MISQTLSSLKKMSKMADPLFCSMGEEIMAGIVDDSSSPVTKRAKTEYDSCGYWGGEGKHQVLFDQVVKDHVPVSGAPTSGGLNAKLVYAVLKLQHEQFNNGFWNAMDQFEQFISVEAYRISEFQGGYPYMLGFLYHHGSAAALEILKHYQAFADNQQSDESEEEDSEESDESEEESDDKSL